MSVADEIREIDEAMGEAGYESPITPRKTRVLKLTYHGTVLSKKNRHIISSHGAVIPDKKARANQQDMVSQFTAQLREQGIADAFTMSKEEQKLKASAKHTVYSITFHIYRPNEIRRDLDNQVTTLLDALVESFAIADDSTKLLRAFAAIDKQVDRDNPRAEITIRITEDA